MRSPNKAELRPHYDFIVCGSGSSGSVIAARLAENPDVSVLLLEAGGDDDIASVMEADQWFRNLGSERDWNFVTDPNPSLHGRTLPMDMGKVLGGGSSINVMCWARGHKNDWDLLASETDDPAWNYLSVAEIYRRIEDWHGSAPDPEHRGAGGPVFVQAAPDPNAVAPALVEAAHAVGIPIFENQNGRMMESDGGVSISDMNVRDGKRRSIFRSYTYPSMDCPNLTVLTGALVQRLALAGHRATGVEVLYEGKVRRIRAGLEVVLSLGAMHTPKVLMQSGIGDQDTLRAFGIPVVQDLPGVGQNFQDHVGVGCVWEYREPLPLRNNGSEATLFWKSAAGLGTPDLQIMLAELPFCSDECVARFRPPAECWSMFCGVVRPKSQGRLLLTGPRPEDPIEIDAAFLSHPDDVKAVIACVELGREIGSSAPLRSFVKREVAPGRLHGAALEDYVRDGAMSIRHQTCTAKMGRDEMSVVDSRFRVYGIENLRVADGSVLPRVSTGNTMGPCVVIGERAGDVLKAEHHLGRLQRATTPQHA